MVLGLAGGELLVVVFVTVAVIAAPWFPRLGAALGEWAAGGRSEGGDREDSA